MSQATKICSMCKKELHITEFNVDRSASDGLQAGCRSCHIEYKAEYEKTNKSVVAQRLSTYKWEFSNKEKKKAHRIVETAIKNGDLIPESCEVCSSLKVEAHHEDYSYPFKVNWLCRQHHRERHQEINKYYLNNPQLILI